MGDAAVVRAVGDDFPAISALRHFHHGDALRMLQHQHIIGRGGHVFGIGRQVHLKVGIFVIDHNHLASGDIEQLHPVGIFAKGAQLASGGHTGIGVECLGIRKQRLAPFGQNARRIAFGQGHRKIGRNRYRLEGKAGGRLRQRRC